MFSKVKVYKVDDFSTASASGILFWKKIKLGRQFYRLPENVQKAIFAHEAGHHHFHHIEKRILCLLFCYPLIYDLCKKQELEADQYAAHCGHARALIDHLKDDWDGGKTHPSHQLRRQSLEKYV